MGAANLDNAGSVGSGGMHEKDVEFSRLDKCQITASHGVGVGPQCRTSLHHGRAFGNLQGQEREILLAGSKRRDQGKRWPIIYLDGTRLDGSAETRCQAKDIETGKADIGTVNRLRL